MDLPSNIQLTCPDCGGEQFRIESQRSNWESFIGSQCVACGHILSREEIERVINDFKQQAAEAIKADLLNRLKNSGFKIR